MRSFNSVSLWVWLCDGLSCLGGKSGAWARVITLLALFVVVVVGGSLHQVTADGACMKL